MDKIAFFGLLIVALLIARFIVVWRTAIVLSAPLELECGGLSVCLPAGVGWLSEKQWKYQQNTFTLDSFFNPGYGSVTALVLCRYHLAATAATAEAVFAEKVSALGGSEIAKTGQIEIGRPGLSFAKGSQNEGILTIDWAYIKRSKTLFDTFFGVAQLPNNRRLDIEVHQTTGDTDLAEGIFKSVAESLKYTDNHLLEAGSKIVGEIKDKGLDSFLAYLEGGQYRENFFLIKDAKGQAIGFTMEVLGSRLAGSPNILGGSFYYLRGLYGREQAAFFQSRNNLSEFVWKSETSGPSGRSGAEIILGKDGIMTVKEFDLQTREKSYQISPAAIPDVLGEFVFSRMLDSDQKKIFVDIIEADGKITPALVSRIDARSPASLQNQSGEIDVAGEETVYVFNVEILDGRGFSEQVYLNSQRRISRRLLQQESTYTLERTGAENILKEFPEQSSYILQRKDKILEQNQPQESSE